ncbi:MAG TPA: hypothetical protein VFP32_03975 [Candidatus Saccharimonadales bacterium]|nr:hypothetical protein [Candidatus Saccharimonadales bacterium]
MQILAALGAYGVLALGLTGMGLVLDKNRQEQVVGLALLAGAAVLGKTVAGMV